jgi:tRNA 5-methylaminomethyl-2-thiouridine biosynthesis bifunctional protein
VIDKALGPATQTSAHGEALCHPYIGRGASRLQRLTFIAFNEAKAVWAANWCGSGVFHLPRNQDGFDKNIMSERLLAQGFNSEMANPLTASEAKEKIGIAAGGTFFPEGGWVNLQQACQDVFEELLPEQKSWATEVKSIHQSKDGWQIYGSANQHIATSKRLFLAGGLGVKNLAKTAGIELPLKPVRGQLSRFTFSKDSSWDEAKPKVALSGKAYCLPPQKMADDQYEWVVGSTYDEEVDDLSVWPDSHDENRALIKEMLNHELVDAELKPIGAFVGIRCVASDRLPIMGPVLNQPGLYILTSLGSRGVMWSALASQMFTEHLAEELHHSAFFDTRFFAGARLAAAGLTADLAGALLAARFLAGASNSKPIFPSA